MLFIEKNKPKPHNKDLLVCLLSPHLIRYHTLIPSQQKNASFTQITDNSRTNYQRFAFVLYLTRWLYMRFSFILNNWNFFQTFSPWQTSHLSLITLNPYFNDSIKLIYHWSPDSTSVNAFIYTMMPGRFS